MGSLLLRNSSSDSSTERCSLGKRAHSTAFSPYVKQKTNKKVNNYAFSDNAVQCIRFFAILQEFALKTRVNLHIAATYGNIEALVQFWGFRLAEARLPLASR
jgi:hypothetical protein